MSSSSTSRRASSSIRPRETGREHWSTPSSPIAAKASRASAECGVPASSTGSTRTPAAFLVVAKTDRAHAAPRRPVRRSRAHGAAGTRLCRARLGNANARELHHRRPPRPRHQGAGPDGGQGRAAGTPSPMSVSRSGLAAGLVSRIDLPAGNRPHPPDPRPSGQHVGHPLLGDAALWQGVPDQSPAGSATRHGWHWRRSGDRPCTPPSLGLCYTRCSGSIFASKAPCLKTSRDCWPPFAPNRFRPQASSLRVTAGTRGDGRRSASAGRDNAIPTHAVTPVPDHRVNDTIAGCPIMMCDGLVPAVLASMQGLDPKSAVVASICQRFRHRSFSST